MLFPIGVNVALIGGFGAAVRASEAVSITTMPASRRHRRPRDASFTPMLFAHLLLTHLLFTQVVVDRRCNDARTALPASR
jgi:hypothetical protein